MAFPFSTCVYTPKDDLESWPSLLTRTRYALKPYGEDNYTVGLIFSAFRLPWG